MISVVRLASTIVVNAFPKPFWIAIRTLEFRARSSRMRSKINTFASTAIPMVNTMPANPGKVNVASISDIVPMTITRLNSKHTSAIRPIHR